MKFLIAFFIVITVNSCALSDRKLTDAECENPAIECAQTVTATFADGVLWVAWVQGEYLYIQHSKDGGSSFSPALPANQIGEKIKANGENRPKIKVSGNDIYLTWAAALGKRFDGNIRFSRSTDGGRTFSRPVTVNDDKLVASHSYDSMAIGKNGKIFVGWLDGRDRHHAEQTGTDYNGSAVYYSWSSDGGATFAANQKIADYSCTCCRLQTAVDAQNSPIVVWRHIFPGNIRDHAIAKFTSWDTPPKARRISHENWQIDGCPHHGAGLSVADDNRYHIVWFSNSSSHQGLFYGNSSNGGKTFSKPFNFAKRRAAHPDILAIADRVFVAWQEYDGTTTRAKLIRSVDGGISWSKPQTISQTNSAKTDNPFLLADGGEGYLSWQIPRQGLRMIRLGK